MAWMSAERPWGTFSFIVVEDDLDYWYDYGMTTQMRYLCITDNR